MLSNKNTVKTWLNTYYNSPPNPTPTDPSCLEEAFKIATQVGTNQYFFDSVYIPVKIPTASGMPDSYTYEKIGFSTQEIAETYGTEHLGNYLVDPCVLIGGIHTPAVNQLAARIKAVFRINKQKYLKLLELQGYTYNPLWNVDGIDEFTFLENQGVNNETTSTNTYDGNLRPAVKTEYEHQLAKNGTADYSATSTFGETVTGGDKFHTEKRVRQGNIGTTKTQELIAAERDNLRFTILQEFFDDVNKQILIGIFDN